MKITIAPNTTLFGALPIGEVFTERYSPDIPCMRIEYAGCDECDEVNAVNLLNGETIWISADTEVVPRPLSEFILR